MINKPGVALSKPIKETRADTLRDVQMHRLFNTQAKILAVENVKNKTLGETMGYVKAKILVDTLPDNLRKGKPKINLAHYAV